MSISACFQLQPRARSGSTQDAEAEFDGGIPAGVAGAIEMAAYPEVDAGGGAAVFRLILDIAGGEAAGAEAVQVVRDGCVVSGIEPPNCS